MRRIWVIGNTPFYFRERGCRELPGFWENSRHRVDRRHREGGTGGGPGASSEAVDEYQFGVVERLDLDRPDIAKRAAVARVGILAVDADATLGGDQIGLASGFAVVVDALSRSEERRVGKKWVRKCK